MIYKIILMAIYTLSLGVNLALDGKPKEGNHNFIKSLIAYIILGVLIYLI